MDKARISLFRRHAAMLLPVLLLVVSSPLLISGYDRNQELEDAAGVADSLQISRGISILAVGDVMLGSNYPSAAYLPPNDGADLLAPVAPMIQAADLAFANFEGVLLTRSARSKCGAGSANCYAFKSPDHYVNNIIIAGFDFVSLANNHSNDFGETGRKNTIRLLDESGIYHAGLLERPSVIFEEQGLKIGFCAFSPNRATLKLNNHAQMKEIVRQLKAKADIVIVSFHCGGEGNKHQHVTRQTEYFLGENRGNPYKFARDAIDAGADLILGHGPHVPRALDIYKSRLIAYSLGNFATYAQFSLSGANGLAPMLQVKLGPQGEFREANIISALQQGKGGPMLDPEQRAFKKIAALTKADFPKSPLIFHEDGRVTTR